MGIVLGQTCTPTLFFAYVWETKDLRTSDIHVRERGNHRQ